SAVDHVRRNLDRAPHARLEGPRAQRRLELLDLERIGSRRPALATAAAALLGRGPQRRDRLRQRDGGVQGGEKDGGCYPRGSHTLLRSCAPGDGADLGSTGASCATVGFRGGTKRSLTNSGPPLPRQNSAARRSVPGVLPGPAIA